MRRPRWRFKPGIVGQTFITTTGRRLMVRRVGRTYLGQPLVTVTDAEPTHVIDIGGGITAPSGTDWYIGVDRCAAFLDRSYT